jgi:hypothetical protein
MRILNFLFKKPTKLQHHFFGAMEFTENKKDPDNNRIAKAAGFVLL